MAQVTGDKYSDGTGNVGGGGSGPGTRREQDNTGGGGGFTYRPVQGGGSNDKGQAPPQQPQQGKGAQGGGGWVPQSWQGGPLTGGPFGFAAPMVRPVAGTSPLMDLAAGGSLGLLQQPQQFGMAQNSILNAMNMAGRTPTGQGMLNGINDAFGGGGGFQRGGPWQSPAAPGNNWTVHAQPNTPNPGQGQGQNKGQAPGGGTGGGTAPLLGNPAASLNQGAGVQRGGQSVGNVTTQPIQMNPGTTVQKSQGNMTAPLQTNGGMSRALNSPQPTVSAGQNTNRQALIGGQGGGQNVTPQPTSIWDAAGKAFRATNEPLIRQQMALSGLSRSTAPANAMARQWNQNMLMPIMNQQLGFEENAINRATQAGFQGAGMLQGLGQQGWQNMSNALNQIMGYGQIGRGVAQEQNNALYEDYMRRHDDALRLLLAPFGQAPNMIGSSTTGKSGKW